jgi:uncharacterized protein YcbK (DUF882 family)
VNEHQRLPKPAGAPLSRRAFLAGAALLPGVVQARDLGVDPDFWGRPRAVWIKRQQTGEEVRAVYFADGHVDWDGYVRVCRVLRDISAGVAAQIDLPLIDALCGAQAFLQSYGLAVPWVATSGLRLRSTNERTEGAARNSKHTEGRATDGHFPGLSLDYQAYLARYYLRGGLGWYPTKHFIHLDTGRLRAWRG